MYRNRFPLLSLRLFCQFAVALPIFTIPAAAALGVVINEVHHDAEPKTERAEFVELLNAGEVEVDLSGWRLEGVGDFVFPSGTTLGAGKFLVVAEDLATMQSKFGVATGHQYAGGLDNDGELLRLCDAGGAEVDRLDYGAGFPWPTAAHGIGASMELIHPELDNDLGGSWRSSITGPTPGAANSVVAMDASEAPPAIRQVKHLPVQPVGGEEVLITAKVTDPDGVGTVILEYQVVAPGSYVRKSDAAYLSAWTEIPMVDDGTGGDVLANDSIYTVTMPGGLQIHRHLVRYRITVDDSLSNGVVVPYADDESPNFAYFVYDGVPAWSGARQPGATPLKTVPSSVMAGALPVYHLVANGTDVINSQYSGGFDGVRMWGTMIYDGMVYDHIQFYNRGEASTYVSGKNKWRFKFNRTRDFEARDIYGKRYQTTWKTMNFNACSSPWLASNRGIAGIDEAVPHRLYQLAGVAGSNTHPLQFRIIDAANEAPVDQYSGDLWGLYLAIEHPDGRFLEEHGLPDGNVYKIQNAVGDKKNQGPTQSTNSSDWSSFYGASANLNTVAWWRANFDLDSYYGFRAINRATGNVDLRDDTNYYMYHHPDGRWRVMPWDLDMIYAPVTHVWPGVIRAQRCLDHPEIDLEFKNRCRELLDLLFSDIGSHGGQAAQVVEELSQVVNPSGVPLTLVDVDECMWSYHPRTAGSHRGPWYLLSKWETRLANNYLRTIPTADHEGFQKSIVDYMYDTDPTPFAVNDADEDGYGFGFLSLEASDASIPDRPTISYSGDVGFPVDGLRFTSGEFSDPQGAGTFGSMQWRIGRISNPGTAGYVVGEPWGYEVEDVWRSGRISPFAAEVSVPVSALRPGETYRARVRHFDNTGRASHWSEPMEFVAGLPNVTFYRESLVISEVMYNPSGGSQHEFIEIQNVGGSPVDLTGVRFTKGIDFDFPDNTTIAPGAYLVVVKNLAAFEAEYGGSLPVVGVWEDGDSLSNGGEKVKLSLGAGTAIHEFIYDDLPPWPTAPDGGGYSLTLACPHSDVDHGDPANWRASVAVGGSPGTGDGVSLATWMASYGLSPGDENTDGDQDGLETLVEFFLGTDPTVRSFDAYPVAGMRSLVVQGVAGEYLTVQFQRWKGADGVSVTGEVSTDLVTWTPAGPVVEFADSATPGFEILTIRAPESSDTFSGSMQFIRLRISAK